VDVPGFKAPIIVAMDASLAVFIRFKYSELFKNMITKCPPRLSKIMSPATAGLVDLQQVRFSAFQCLRSGGTMKKIADGFTVAASPDQ
jgi:hypothetical protein